MVDSVASTPTSVTPSSVTAPVAAASETAATGFQTALDETANASPQASEAAATQTASAAASTTTWMASAEEAPAAPSTSLLLSIDEAKARASAGGNHRYRPTLAEFMDKSGADWQTSADIVAGVVGAQEDPRDWTAIMASANPLQSAREATGQMINSVEHVEFNRTILDKLGYTRPDPSKTIASAGNFGVIDLGTTPSGQPNLSISIVDALGQPVGPSLGWDAPSIVKAARDYNLSLKPLADLADKLDAKGIRYEPYELYLNTGSDAGIDLRDLARGGLGTAYDWRQEDSAALKGDQAALDSIRRANLAAELKLVLNSSVTTGGGVDASKLGAQAVGDTKRTAAVVSNGSAVWLATQAAAEQYSKDTGGTVVNLS